MNPHCRYNPYQVWFYLDGELFENELTHFELHLQECLQCRCLLKQKQDFVRAVRLAAPLYPAPTLLRKRIQDMTQGCHSLELAPEHLRTRIQRNLSIELAGFELLAKKSINRRQKQSLFEWLKKLIQHLCLCF